MSKRTAHSKVFKKSEWRLPSVGVRLVIIHFRWDFPSLPPASQQGSPVWRAGNLQMTGWEITDVSHTSDPAVVFPWAVGQFFDEEVQCSSGATGAVNWPWQNFYIPHGTPKSDKYLYWSRISFQLSNLTFCFVLHVSSSLTWAFTSIWLPVTNFFFPWGLL